MLSRPRLLSCGVTILGVIGLSILAPAAEPSTAVSLLDKTISVQTDMPMRYDELLALLGRQAGVRITLAPAAISRPAVGRDAMSTLTLDDIPLRSALRLLKRRFPDDLVAVERDGGIQLTTHTDTDSLYSRRVFRAPHLLAPQADDSEELEAELGTALSVIAPPEGAWQNVGSGYGSFAFDRAALQVVVRQTDDMHGAVQRLLEATARAAEINQSAQNQGARKPGDFSAISAERPPTANERAIQEALRTEFAFPAGEMKLPAFVAELARQFQIPILVDETALVRQGLSPTQTIIQEELRATLADFLDFTLRRHGLVYAACDGVPLITLAEEREGSQATRVYPVGDFIGAASRHIGREQLVALAQRIAVHLGYPWQESDRFIAPLPIVQSLVVRGTEETHRRFESLLTAWRAERGERPEAVPTSTRLFTRRYRLRDNGFTLAATPKNVAMLRQLLATTSFTEDKLRGGVEPLDEYFIVTQTDAGHRRLRRGVAALGFSLWEESSYNGCGCFISPLP